MDKKVCKKFSQNLQRLKAEELDAATVAHTHYGGSSYHFYISLLNRWTNILWKDDLENFLFILPPNDTGYSPAKCRIQPRHPSEIHLDKHAL